MRFTSPKLVYIAIIITHCIPAGIETDDFKAAINTNLDAVKTLVESSDGTDYLRNPASLLTLKQFIALSRHAFTIQIQREGKTILESCEDRAHIGILNTMRELITNKAISCTGQPEQLTTLDYKDEEPPQQLGAPLSLAP